MTTTPHSSEPNVINRIQHRGKQAKGSAAQDESINKNTMITKVTVRPNPFHTVLTLDVSCESNTNIIVRMFSQEGRIVKMFSWYLVKGTNVTAINELGNLTNGLYVIDIIDQEGKVLFATKHSKE